MTESLGPGAAGRGLPVPCYWILVISCVFRSAAVTAHSSWVAIAAVEVNNDIARLTLSKAIYFAQGDVRWWSIIVRPGERRRSRRFSDHAVVAERSGSHRHNSNRVTPRQQALQEP